MASVLGKLTSGSWEREVVWYAPSESSMKKTLKGWRLGHVFTFYEFIISFHTLGYVSYLLTKLANPMTQYMLNNFFPTFLSFSKQYIIVNNFSFNHRILFMSCYSLLKLKYLCLVNEEFTIMIKTLCVEQFFSYISIL